jgi:signal transduction histidine kinase
LSVIRFNAAALQRLPEAAEPTRIRNIAQAIERAIESQTRIIDDLLDFSRAQIGKLTLRRVEVDFGTLVIELVETFSANLAAGRVRLEAVPPSPLICYADPVRLQQIAGNLLSNAIKFTATSGQVVVRISSEDGFARLSVADSGCGIAPELLPHVFALFRQADSGTDPHGGLGIGLALVHGLTVAHGGSVKATSEGINRGAEFSVWLPLSQSASRAPDPAVDPA